MIHKNIHVSMLLCSLKDNCRKRIQHVECYCNRKEYQENGSFNLDTGVLIYILLKQISSVRHDSNQIFVIKDKICQI